MQSDGSWISGAYAADPSPAEAVLVTACDVLDVAVAQSEAEIEPEGLLEDDARIAVAVVSELVHKQTLYGPCVRSHCVTVTVPSHVSNVVSSRIFLISSANTISGRSRNSA
jgi:hypothetical protein